MTPAALTPVQVQLLIDLADADLAEWDANARVLISRVTDRSDDQRAALVQAASAAGVRHAMLRQQWLDVQALR